MLNVVALMGRLTVEPELKHTQTNIAVASFQIAVDRSFVKQGSERQADFINIVCWRNQAEFVCKYFKKGQLIAVDGSFQSSNYQDSQGNKRSKIEVVANNVHFAESKRDPNRSEVHPGENLPAPSFISGDAGDFEEIHGDDELPF